MAAPFVALCRERLRGLENRPRRGPCPFPRAQTLPDSRRSPNGHNPVEQCNNINPDLGIATPHRLVPTVARTPQQVQANGPGHVTGPNNTGFVCDSCRDSTFVTHGGPIRTVLRRLRIPTCLACHDMERWRHPRGKARCKCEERLEEVGCSACIWNITHQIERLGTQYKNHLKRARHAINGATYDATRPRGPIKCRCGDLRSRRGQAPQNVVLFCLACREVIVNAAQPNPATLRPRPPIVYPLVDVATGNLL